MSTDDDNRSFIAALLREDTEQPEPATQFAHRAAELLASQPNRDK